MDLSRDCSPLIAGSDSVRDLLDGICRVAVAPGRYRHASVLTCSDDSGDASRPLAEAVAEGTRPETDSTLAPSMALSLLGGRQRVGLLRLVAHGDSNFDDDERMVLEHLALELGQKISLLCSRTALRNAELRIDYLSDVLRVPPAADPLHDGDHEQVLQRACDLVASSLGLELCCLVLRDPGKQRRVTASGSESAVDAVRELSAQGGLPHCARTALSDERAVLRVERTEACAACGVCAKLVELGARSVDAISVRVDNSGTGYGVLLAASRSRIEAEPLAVGFLRDVASDVAYALRTLENESRRRRAEYERDAAVTYLREVNECRSSRELVEASVRFFREKLAFDAAGIRLQSGDDFPYYEARGFPSEFIDEETPLCRRDAKGAVVCDHDRNPILDCICGAVIRGRVDPSKPYATPEGSFWTNQLTEVLDGGGGEFPNVRGLCGDHGYKSVGLFPLRSGDRCIGLLQLNDKRPGRFTSHTVTMYERLASHLAVALAKCLADEALADTEARTTNIFAHLPNPTFLWQRRGGETILKAFNRATPQAGEPGSVEPGAKAAEVFADVPGVLDQIESCFNARSTVRREIECRLPSTASPGRYDLTCCFIPPNMVLLTADDVTEQRKMEERLRRAQRLEAVGQLAGGVAHDFNNLLSIIIPYAGMALDSVAAGDPIRDDLIEIQKAGERAAALTRQLLAFSRKQVLQPEVVDLNKIIVSMEGLLRRLIGEDVVVSLALADQLRTVKADPGQIEQVIMNLAVNARDAMPTGGRLIIETRNVVLDESYVERQVAARPGPHVILSVSDTGIGMDRQTKDRIFEPFFTTKAAGKGTGLGLSTVYGIVKQSGGNVWVYSEPGRGTTMKVCLPCHAEGLETEVAQSVASPGPARDETVLVVEDDSGVRGAINRMLTAAGYRVLAAGTGDEALRLSGDTPERIDVLLTDVVMPSMSGRELASRVTASRPNVKVVFMSGYADSAIAHHGVLAPGTNFISKPFSPHSLCHRLREILEAPAGAPRSPQHAADRAFME